MADTNAQPRKLPTPEANAETQTFWDAAKDGKLLIKRCESCTKPHYYPRAICPYCGSFETKWEESAGKGVIYSHSVMRRGAGTPYTIAYVTLDEGLSMMTNIVDCDHDALAIGDRVTVRFVETDGPPVPMFTPDRA